jgi:aminoglycoside 3-N-acetyltransferase
MDYLTKEDIIRGFRECGIRSGSVLMLHLDAIFLSQTQPMSKKDRYALFFEALNEVLGPEGTLVIPTFTYSATKGDPFIVEETPSTVGDLTEYFRKMPAVKRTRDPIFSVAVIGQKTTKFCEAKVGDSFGKNSIFDLLDQSNAWLGCVASKFLVTHTHFVEQSVGVDYRYFKNYEYRIIENGVEQKGVLKYYVRDLKRESEMELALLEKRLKEKEQFQKGKIGRFSVSLVSSKDFRREAEYLISEKGNALIKEGS